jgi:hypothetical protein
MDFIEFYQSRLAPSIKALEDMTHNYNKTKDAITKKINSATALKQTFHKNTKYANKITAIDSTNESKLQYLDKQIKENMDKCSSEISAIKAKYEAKIESEIALISAKTNNYHAYLVSQRELITAKKENQIRDLSNNIVEPTIGEELDEDAYPVLVKLKADIEKQKVVIADCRTTYAYMVEEDAKKSEYRRQEAAAQAREEQRKAEEAHYNARLAEAARQKEQRESEELRAKKQNDERKRQAASVAASAPELTKEELAQQKKDWKQKFYTQLSPQRQKVYDCLSGFRKVRLYSKTNLLLIVKYLDEYANITLARHALEEKYYNEKSDDYDPDYFTEQVWVKFNEMPEEQQEIVAVSKSKDEQVKLIQKYKAPKINQK